MRQFSLASMIVTALNVDVIIYPDR